MEENKEKNEKLNNIASKKSKSSKITKDIGKLNLTQKSKTTNKEINLESVSSLQDFGVEIDKNASDKPTEIEKKHVYEVYDKISEHFSLTRYKPWPQVSDFLNSLPDNSFLLDVGCGNGNI